MAALHLAYWLGISLHGLLPHDLIVAEDAEELISLLPSESAAIYKDFNATPQPVR
jgi:hypothetical protein